MVLFVDKKKSHNSHKKVIVVIPYYIKISNVSYHANSNVLKIISNLRYGVIVNISSQHTMGNHVNKEKWAIDCSLL